MTSPFDADPMSPKERAKYGAALAKGAAFDAVGELWRRRKVEKWTLGQVADAIDVDLGWLSKQFNGPRNWTMETFGALVEGLNGEIEIIARPIEHRTSKGNNYDAYVAMDDLPSPSSPPKSDSSQGVVNFDPGPRVKAA